MDYHVEVLADSIGPHGVRLTTFHLRYPRAAAHEDFLTHRRFSRSASSSRAIPIERMIKRATWGPELFGRAQPGMGADEVLDEPGQAACRAVWNRARDEAVAGALRLAALGAAKEDANLLLRPFEWIDVVVSSTEWGNFFRQRADQETGLVRRQLKRVADGMRDLLASRTPWATRFGEWHLPYLTTDELLDVCAGRTDRVQAARASAMRCARTSYARHDGTHGSVDEDAQSCLEKLVRSAHWSPLEHPARCEVPGSSPTTNFADGWGQLRTVHPHPDPRPGGPRP